MISKPYYAPCILLNTNWSEYKHEFINNKRVIKIYRNERLKRLMHPVFQIKFDFLLSSVNKITNAKPMKIKFFRPFGIRSGDKS